jgi:hypothetical protein
MDSAFCGLHNDKYIKFQSIGNCKLRACMQNSESSFFFRISRYNMQFGKIEDMCLVSEKIEALSYL